MKRFFTSIPLALIISLIPVLLCAQTPGLIVKNAGSGITVLDLNGDGYVSALTNSLQLGFTIPPNNDVIQSEIPYAPLVLPDPSSDLLSGPSCSYSDIIGIGAVANNAVMAYYNSTSGNLMFRFRIAKYATNSKGYNILVDTDGKFGFSGPNADLNAVPGNAGFEVEIVLETNFGVEVYKVDGTTSPLLQVGFATNPYATHCQKSIAVTNGCGDADYFYDFYIPFSQLTAIPGLGITTSTPMRFVALTCMNPAPAAGNNAQSDIGGTSATGNLDVIYNNLIQAQTPTSITNINTTGVLTRSDCPTIASVSVGSSVITGSSTEVSGSTVTVSVYQSNGTTLIGSGTTTVQSGGLWSINVTTLSPTVTLAAGQYVRAQTQAIGEGVSYDDCDIELVTSGCTVQTSIPTTLPAEIKPISGGKGYDIVLTSSRPVGTKVYLYTSDYNLRTVTDLKNSVTNPFTTTTSPQTFSFECQTGNCFGTGVYYFRFQEPGKCISEYYTSCDYATGTSTVPTITNSTITTSTTAVTGNGSTTGSAQILIYANGIKIASATSAATSPFAYSATVSGLSLCQVITAKQIETGKCVSTASNSLTVTRPAIRPVITTSACSVSAPGSIGGYSTEANGSTITLYKTNPSRISIGTGIVTNGAWTITPSPSLVSGDIIVAAVTAGSCLTISPDSDSRIISTQTNIAGYTIGITAPSEGATSVSGTISSAYTGTLKLYVDQYLVGSTSLTSATTWTVSGITPSQMSVGSTVQVTLTSASNCESALSATYALVQCSTPLDKTLSASIDTYCANSQGAITIGNSEAGVIYTPILSGSNTLAGVSASGNGGDLTLSSLPLTTNPTVIAVKASKLGTSCETILTGSVTFYVLTAATITGSQTIVSGGDPTILTVETEASGSISSYQWQSSTTSASSGFHDIVGASSPTYDPPSGLTVNKWYKRKTTSTLNSVTCTTESNVLEVSIATKTFNCGGGATDWNVATSWSDGIVPSATDNIIIPPGCIVHVTTTSAVCKNINIAGGGVLIIDPTAALTVLGSISNDAGASGLILKSTSAGTGQLITDSKVQATVENYLSPYGSGADGCYHYISSPVSGMSIQTYFGDLQSVTDDFYLYSETQNAWVNARTLDASYAWNNSFYIQNGNSWNFQVGKGYMVAVGTASTKIFTGNLNVGNVVVPVSYTSASGKGYNLIGNPFPSSLNLGTSAWSNYGMCGGFYAVQCATYVTSNGGVGALSTIAPEQGFFVHTNTTQDFTIPSAAQTISSSLLLKNVVVMPEVLKLTISGQSYTDEIYIRFVPDATEGFDCKYDSYKFPEEEGSLYFYSVAADSKMAINALPALNGDVNIPLGMTLNDDDTYTIRLLENTLSGADNIWLQDSQTGSIMNLREIPEYLFSGSAGIYSNRFQLKIGKSLLGGISTESAEDKFSVYYYDKLLTIDHSEGLKNVNVVVSDLTGRTLFISPISGGHSERIEMDFTSGIYIVTVRSASFSKSQKIVVF